MQPFRITPSLPVQAYKTYAVLSPVPTHTRPASCAEVECEPWRHGWATTVDLTTELGRRQADYVRGACGRRFTEARVGDAAVIFRFAAGQPCFQSGQHRVPLDRPPLYLVRDGDWRGNPRGTERRHTRAEEWVEDFAGHQQGLADRIKRG